MGSAGMYGGTQKCGRVNVLGHERMFRAYAETWLSHVRTEFYLLEVNRS